MRVKLQDVPVTGYHDGIAALLLKSARKVILIEILRLALASLKSYKTFGAITPFKLSIGREKVIVDGSSLLCTLAYVCRGVRGFPGESLVHSLCDTEISRTSAVNDVRFG